MAITKEEELQDLEQEVLDCERTYEEAVIARRDAFEWEEKRRLALAQARAARDAFIQDKNALASDPI